MGEWVREFFLALFRKWLGEELPGARIFVDKSAIESGEWPEKVQAAVQSSRTLVPVWSPNYFLSPWCTYEWRAFEARRSKDLIMPIQFHDGDSFPENARRAEMTDFRRFARTVPAFRETRDFVDFEDHVKQFSVRVAEVARRAEGDAGAPTPIAPPPITPPGIPPPPSIPLLRIS